MSHQQGSRPSVSLLTLSVAATALLLLVAEARGHGNAFVPKIPTFPSGGGPVGGPTAPGPSGPSMPGPGATPQKPSNGSSGAKPPTLGRPGEPPQASSGPNAPSAVGKAGALGAGPAFTGIDLSGPTDAWEVWWHDNEERFLALRSRLDAAAPSSRTGVLTGIGRVERGGTRRAAAMQVDQEVLPLLFDVLARGDDEPEVTDSALIALGRCADEADAERVLMAVRPLLSSEVINVQTSAVLALGIHGSPRFVPLLGALMDDTPMGRTAVGGGQVAPLIRSLAALSLGLGNHEVAVPLLADLVRNLPDAEAQLKACVITALGVTGNTADDVALGTLLALLKDQRLDAPLAAHVPLALARLGGGTRAEAVPALLAAFSDRDTDDVVRVSLATALGRLASATDAPVLDALEAFARNDKHEPTRHAALMALAEIGRRDALQAVQHAETHKRLVTLLKRGLTDGGSNADRAWMALAAGVYAQGGAAGSVVLQELLLELHHDCKDPATRGAVDLALGLSHTQEAADLLLKDFRDEGEALLRGHAAVALGLLGITDASAEMLALCGDKGTEPFVREQVALGLALLRDPQVVPTLVDVLGRVQVHPVSLAVARALGRIGDRSAIPALTALAMDEQRTETTRGMAVVALGLLGERGELPWNATLRELHNPETDVAALQMVFDIL